ncbi:hypothetical protein GCM10009609_65960 [Pseudonocardia aurantiaca]|uniref:Acyl carrier protein n=1 Tax=Pseudonocardia aurantiaca TaxID=75290 RepID=A0ABW4FT79_9PSEU
MTDSTALTPWQVRDWLIAAIAEMLRVEAAEVSSETVFRELGLSSVQLVQMTADLEDILGREVPPTFLFDCPTIEDAVVYLTATEPSGEAASHG